MSEEGPGGTTGAPPSRHVARLHDVHLHYRKTTALDGVTLDIPDGSMVGLIGPDGVGKSSLMALVAGARAVQAGYVETLGGDMTDAQHRRAACLHIAYMPQGLGKNLYPALTIEENLQFFGRLFGHDADERRRRIDELTAATGLQPFLNRQVGRLSGGMKQKLGLCCALIHDPQLLILDEPTTGVDPLARNQFWDLINRIRARSSEISVLISTAYMDEAERFDWLVAMDAGRVLATGTPRELHEQTGTDSLEAAFIALLPEEKKRGHKTVEAPPLEEDRGADTAIEARDLTKRFGDFTAVDHASFRIRRGEIFGFLGSNGCGKTTTMKMLTGLLPASEGQAWLFGNKVDPHDIATRQRVGYMSQDFSLYSELSVRQNLVLHARLFHVGEHKVPSRVDEMVERFGLGGVLDALPSSLPLGARQRLSLAVAMVHKPELLILDEPTAGVDPVARDNFWQLMIDLSRGDNVTIFLSTHFMNEAKRCDRISLMHAGQVLASGAPDKLIREQGTETLEEAFIDYLKDAQGEPEEQPDAGSLDTTTPPRETAKSSRKSHHRRFSVARAFSHTLREFLELRCDPLRATLALAGSAFMMFIVGFGMNMDVEDLSFAVLDMDQTALSRDYALNISGSRYFVEHPPITSYVDLDRRMRSGELSLAIEIPPGFARSMKRGTPVPTGDWDRQEQAPAQIGAWVDGAMPSRAETIKGYVEGMHQHWLATVERQQFRQNISAQAATVETRFRYNPQLESLPAMVPAVIAIQLILIPAMLTAMAIVREKELGSITNLYVTPVTRMEFLLGKQLPYVVLSMLSFFLMTLLAVTVLGVPLKGSVFTLTLGALIYVLFSTGFGLLVSTFTRSQIAALFTAALATIIPAIQFSGLFEPVSSLEGAGQVIGQFYPATHFMTISRGVFNKALGFSALYRSLGAMLLAVPVIIGLSLFLLKKQEV